MEYQDAVDAFFAARPEGTLVPDVVTAPSPARRLRDSVEPVAMHPVWSPLTNARLAGLGLNFLTAYVGGRAAVLGSPVPSVVVSSFAWFAPPLVAALYDASRDAAPTDRLLAAREEATVDSLRAVLAGDDPSEVADALADAVEPAEGVGRPFFSAIRGRGRPGDPVQRLWWACELVREHRGDSHVAAAASAGLGPVEMNVLTELWLGMPMLSYTGTRGWDGAEMDRAVASLQGRGWLDDAGLTKEGRAARETVEERTDAQERSVVDALGDRLEEVCVALDGWGQRCIEAGCFPRDVLKRAAG